MPGGHESTYDPSVIPTVLNMASNGDSIVAIAASLKVRRKTLYKWAQQFPEFGDTLEHAQELCQAWWENFGKAGCAGKIKNFQGNVWKFFMACRFKDDYTETTKQEVVNVNPPTINVNLKKES